MEGCEWTSIGTKLKTYFISFYTIDYMSYKTMLGSIPITYKSIHFCMS